MSILYVRDKDGQFTQIPIFAGQDSGGNVENGEDGFSPIAKVEQTATGAVISITDKDGTTTATITNGKDGKDGVDGQPGKDGADGAKGDKGDTGAQGEPGKDGANGKDGTSATHSWNGTVLTITSASGTSSADLKGAKGDKGDKGDTGAQGIQGEPGAKGDTGAKGDKGEKGDTGATGTAGYSPVRGTDYWTASDQAAIANEAATRVKTEVPLVKTAEQPTFVNSVDEMTDISKVYLMADGHLWAHMTKDDPGRVLTANDFEIGGLMSGNGTDGSGSNRARTGQLACTLEQPISITVNGSGKWLVHFFQNGTWIGKTDMTTASRNDVAQLCDNPSAVTHVRILLGYSSNANVEDLSDLVGQFTIIQAGMGTVTTWADTGLAYNQPADYEARVIALENELGVLLNGAF